MQQDEQKSRDLQDRIIQQEEVKAPTAEDLKVLRDQLRSEVERYWYSKKNRLELHNQENGSRTKTD